MTAMLDLESKIQQLSYAASELGFGPIEIHLTSFHDGESFRTALADVFGTKKTDRRRGLGPMLRCVSLFGVKIVWPLPYGPSGKRLLRELSRKK